MKPERKRSWLKWLTLVSVGFSLCLTTAVLVVFSSSGGMRLLLHEGIADRLGRSEIAMLGDSITHGGGIWALRLDRPVGTVRNFGHAALYVEQMGYQAELAAATGVGLAFLMGGINDAGREEYSPAACFEEYLRIVDALRANDIEVVIQSTLYRSNGEGREFVSSLNEQLRHLAKSREGVEFLDVNEVLSEGQRLKDDYSHDGTHLTEAAYLRWGGLIRDYLADRASDRSESR